MTDEERNEQNEERDDEERDEDEGQESEGSSGDSSGDDDGDSGDGDSGDSGDGDSGGEESSSSDDDGDDDGDSGDGDSGDDEDSGDGDDGDDDSGDGDGGDEDSAPKVSDVMTKDPQSVEPGDSIEDAAAKMKEADAGAMLVVDGDELKGIVTDRDISNAVGEGNADAKVEDIASTDLTSVAPDDTLDDAINKMREAQVRRLPVVEDDKPVGIVSLGDLASAADDDSALKDISESEPNA